MPNSDHNKLEAAPTKRKPIKCLVWDLDDTLWPGKLLDGQACKLHPSTMGIVRELDARGILQSIASKNDHHVAWPQLQALGVADFFLHPQISWHSKAESIRVIAEKLGIGLDAVAFIDDQAAERDEVKYFLPQVTVFDATQLRELLERDEFKPEHITDESRMRREMYRIDIARTEAQEQFKGSRDAFLATLNMRLLIRRALAEDLRRAEELTLRTNQLNTTGIAYSYDELKRLTQSNDHMVLVAKLDDRYGSSGTVGLALVETSEDAWTIRLLIMSCRVMTRGVGTVLLGYLLRAARHRGVQLRAAFVHSDRNRQMYMTYKFAGFRESGRESDALLLDHDLKQIHPFPSYITLESDLSQDGTADLVNGLASA
jgi:FkbH-like protein